jgi:uncharacterized protein YceK
MRKIFGLLALTVLVGTTLAGCSTVPGTTAKDPADGYWATAVVNDKPVGDLWCIRASSYSRGAVDCEWSTFSAPHSHKDTLEVAAEYRYVLTAERHEEKLLCINYVMRKGYHVINCNWESLANR